MMDMRCLCIFVFAFKTHEAGQIELAGFWPMFDTPALKVLNPPLQKRVCVSSGLPTCDSLRCSICPSRCSLRFSTAALHMFSRCSTAQCCFFSLLEAPVLVVVVDSFSAYGSALPLIHKQNPAVALRLYLDLKCVQSGNVKNLEGGVVWSWWSGGGGDSIWQGLSWLHSTRSHFHNCP